MLLILIIGLGIFTLWRDYQDASACGEFLHAVVGGIDCRGCRRRFVMDALANHLLGLQWPLTDGQINDELSLLVDSGPLNGPLSVSAEDRHWSLPEAAFQDIDRQPPQDVGRKVWLPVIRRYQYPKGKWLIVDALVPLISQRDYFYSLGYKFDIFHADRPVPDMCGHPRSVPENLKT